MDVDVVLVEQRRVDPDVRSARLQVGQGRSSRLAHHLAQLPRHLQLALAGRQRGLDEDDLAAGRRPHQPGRDAGPVDALSDVVVEAALAQRGAHLLHVVDLLHLLARRDVRHVAPDHRSDLSLQVAHARLARVLADDQPHRRLGHQDLVRSQPVRVHLLRHEEALGDLHLLLLGVTGEVQHLHAVAQGGRDGLERVGGGDEHHLRKVERHIEIVVAEVLVLLRVEDLQQR